MGLEILDGCCLPSEPEGLEGAGDVSVVVNPITLADAMLPEYTTGPSS